MIIKELGYLMAVGNMGPIFPSILAYGHSIALAQQLVGSLALAGDI